MDVYVGWPVKVHDAHIFSNLDIYKQRKQGTLFPDRKKNISGVQVPSIHTKVMYFNLLIIIL